MGLSRNSSGRRALPYCTPWRLLLAAITVYGLAAGAWWLFASNEDGASGTKSLALHRQSLGRASGSNGTVSAAGNATDEALVGTGEVQAPEAVEPTFSCRGWRQTGGCDPNGPRERANDQRCDQPVTGGASGYCVLLDTRTGQEVRAMELTCSSVRRDTQFECDDAVAVLAFQSAVRQTARAAVALAASSAAPSLLRAQAPSRHGIVMAIYPKLLVSAYATLRMLRALGCTLPVELWYLEFELSAATVASDPLLRRMQQELGPLTLHAIADARVTGFNSKVHAILRTQLDVVLFLDADNVPARDPTFLFTSAELAQHGAVFWPDFWHPRNTIFNILNESLLWDVADTPFVDMMEQESGQVLIDRRRSSAALAVLELFAFHSPNLFESLRLAHGDKDLFRLAWLKTATPFHMVKRPPGAAGRLSATGVFCGMTMVQFDPSGRGVLFLHRNAQKLSNNATTARVWTHLQTFELPEPSPWRIRSFFGKRDDDDAAADWYDAVKNDYDIMIYSSGDAFPEAAMCYGERREADGRSGRFRTVAWTDLPDPALHGLEDRLLEFAQDAVGLR